MFNKKIIIVGSGTSGLIAALMLKTRFQQANVKILYSKKIDIIGVGEATTEHLKRFMLYCDISFKDFICKTDATVKLYIKFIDWTKKDYYHHVGGVEVKELVKYFYYFGSIISKNLPKKYVLSDIAYKYGKIDFDHAKGTNWDIANQYNFDTFKLNILLTDKAKEIGIEFEEDFINDIFFDEQGFVSSLKGEKKNYTADFYIDASGFNRTIIKKINSFRWISYQKFLPLDRALVFPDIIEKDFKYTMCTTSKALNYGWNFQVPTQTRTGNGYIYTSEYISDDEAVDEISKVYKKKIKPAKFFNLNAGRLNKFWIKNVITLGISSSFVEPLEATAISSTIQQTFLLIDYLASEDRDSFNEHSEKLFENIVDFLQLHYYVDKKDSNFWRELKKNLVWRENVILNIKKAQNRLLNTDDFQNHPRNLLFGPVNWNCVLFGLDLFNIEKIKKEFDNMVPNWLLPEIENYLNFKANYQKRNLIDELSIYKMIKNESK